MQHYAKIIGACALVIAVGLLTSVGAARADRWQGLREDAEIEAGVLVIAIGDMIVDNCPVLEARRMPTIGYMMDLANRALDLGYSRAEIVAYVEDDAEKERVRALARRWLAQQGASVEDSESLCRVGRDEISAGSSIGRLLREG